ncbi:Heavy metal tolerance protein [Cytospora mali]|uniref:Heavy metal tolerance protein n=1 Tax=Cytospora mali TaxID=578113 RepID=A0A194VDQ6_CYTMA|nr:Heavy metal tolerance protein [Valsa mali var. pyri (nom. inval.)]
MAREVAWRLSGYTAAEVLFLDAEVIYPFLLLLSYGIIFAVHSVIASQGQEDVEKPSVTGPGGKPLPVTRIKVEKSAARNTVVREFSRLSHLFFKAGTTAVILTFVANALHIIHQCARARWENIQRYCNDELLVYITGGIFYWGYIGFSLISQNDKPNAVHFSIWCIGLVFELIILATFLVAFNDKLDKLQSVDSHSKLQFNAHQIPSDTALLSSFVIRVCFLLGMVVVYGSLRGHFPSFWPTWKSQKKEEPIAMTSDETTPLLNGLATGLENGNGHTNGHANGNGAVARSTRRRMSEARRVNGTAKGSRQKQAEFAFYRPEKLPHRSWWEYLRGYHVFFPYLWPAKKVKLQMLVLLCFVLVILQRAVNVLVPIQLGVLVKALTEAAKLGADAMPWKQLFIFLGLKLMQGPSAILGSLRSILWIPVTQHSYVSLQTAAFEHVHSLSLDFHLGKRTGELLSALNKGGSVNQFLEQTTFQVAPMLMDLFIAIGFFWVEFGPLYALWATIITFSYLVLTIRMASTRADQRRDMVNADREEEAVKNDSITAYETVKYFNAEAFEFKRYHHAIKAFQNAEARVTFGMNLMNMWQTVVFISGMLIVMAIAAYEVVLGRRTVAEFVMIMTYLNQLQGPLNFFGSFYRTVQQAMISGERLLELFKIQPNMVDRPGVPPLRGCQGHIRWNHVDFDYANSPALTDLTFECRPGTTTAFVGESGGGKSTIFRLMFRYYNCKSGTIEIDGHDVKDLTIDSVRRAIGVVPQETILFNDTIMYNLKYANPECSDEEIYEACRAASIHERIMSFADGYQTRVGDRGMRLSGGEKQRVAIARTILKKPRIIMLDEATSALDSETEQQIQHKLFKNKELGEGKTLLIIAHRLSTITHAEQILVLHRGKIVERGTHDELLNKHGRYHSMWEKQAKAEMAAKAANMAKEKAERAMREARLAAKDSGDDHSDDGGDSMASSCHIPTAPTTPAHELPGLNMIVH